MPPLPLSDAEVKGNFLQQHFQLKSGTAGQQAAAEDAF